MNPQKYLLDKLPIAIALFNNDAELIFYNKALLELWKLDEYFVKEQPNIIEFFEVVREKDVAGERINFREFVNSMYKIAISGGPYYKKDSLILPNGLHLQEILSKEGEYLSISWEDVSETFDVIHSLSNYKNLYNRLIEKNPKPLLVIASNGIIESYNSKFLETFNISREILDGKIHVRELLADFNLVKNAEDKALLLGNLVSSRTFSITLELNENETLAISGIYLQNSNTFVQWDLQNKNISVAEIDTDSVLDLHKNLIVDLNHLVGSPVSNIIGFADLLNNEYAGSLNIRQKEYMDKIISSAEFINEELNHKIILTQLENSHEPLELDSVDINICLANILYQIKPRLRTKNIGVKLDVPNNVFKIKSSEDLINKAFILLLMYMIEQNNNNAEIIIEVSQINKESIFTFKDTAKLPLLADEDLAKRYDINLALSILKKLGFTYESASRQRAYRVLSIKYLNK
ncbi:MAG: PAS domain-containing protein [Alphaproteobacteria bacterium]|nr:PAS domain-containing protein [Alphaproteobacteria bacterium]